jgi:hypothetical protein
MTHIYIDIHYHKVFSCIYHVLLSKTRYIFNEKKIVVIVTHTDGIVTTIKSLKS